MRAAEVGYAVWGLNTDPIPPPPAAGGCGDLRIRVDLYEAKPPIWRRLELASDLTLDQLHDVVQTAMG